MSKFSKNTFRLSDTYVQFELYRLLVNKGYYMIAEYPIPHGRIDLMLLINNVPVAAIECKYRYDGIPNKDSRQYKKYNQYCIDNNIVFYYVTHSNQLNDLVNEITTNWPLSNLKIA